MSPARERWLSGAVVRRVGPTRWRLVLRLQSKVAARGCRVVGPLNSRNNAGNDNGKNHKEKNKKKKKKENHKKKKKKKKR